MSHVVFMNENSISFTCEANDFQYTPTWKLNGTLYSSLSSNLIDELSVNGMTVGSNTYRTILRIPAKLAYNGTEVQCYIIGNNNKEITSPIAYLTLQGEYSYIDLVPEF